MTDKSINWQSKPPSTTEIPAPPSSPRDRDRASRGLGPATQSLAAYFTPVTEEPIVPTAPSIMQELNRERAIEWRIDKLNSNYPDCEGNLDLLLEKVCLDGRLDDAGFLLSIGAKGDAVLRSAINSGDSELINVLLSNGVKHDDALFVEVCRNGDPLCAQVFLSHGANAEAQIGDHTLFGLMCSEGKLEIVELLLYCGAQVERRSDGKMPLYLAATSNADTESKIQIIKKLLDRGANIDELNGTRKITALGAACDREDVVLVGELLKLGAKADGPARKRTTAFNSPLDICLGNKPSNDEARLTILGMLIDKIDVHGERGTILLWRCCEFGTVEPALLLLKKGVNPNLIVNSGKYSPLMAAAGSSKTPVVVVQALLEAGADVKAKSATGQTAMDYLHATEDSQSMDFKQKMKLLLRYHTAADRQTNSEREI